MRLFGKKDIPADAAGTNDAVRRPFRARIPGYTIAFLALLGIALIIWKIVAVTVMQDEQEEAMQALRDSTDRRITERTVMLARTTGEAVASAAAAALRMGGIDQLRAFCDELSQRTTVREYLAADAGGTIIAATNRSMEGNALPANLRRITSSLDEPVVDTIENGLTRVSMPLRFAAGATGTLILTFRFP